VSSIGSGSASGKAHETYSPTPVKLLDRRTRSEGRAGGQYYEYEFKVDLTTVCEVVGDLEGIAVPDTVARHT
jgi:hypothetical protein